MKANFISTLFLVLISLPILSQSWISQPNFPGNARFNATAFTANSKAYLIFGAAGQTHYNDFWEYNDSTAQWTSLGNSPAVGRKQAVAFSIDSFAYVGLGRVSTTSDLNDFWSYNVHTNSWTQLSNYPGEGRFNCFYGAVNGEGYVGGGAEFSPSATYSNEFWKFNPSNSSWKKLPDLPFGARGSGVSVVNDSLLIFGFGHDLTNASKEFWAYNANNATWTQLPTFPGSARLAPTGFMFQNKMIVGGGQVLGTSTILSDWYEFDFITNSWTAITGFSAGQRSRDAFFTLNGEGYIVTGQGTPVGVNNLNDFWKYGNLSTGLQSKQEESKINLYPNPCQGLINIELNGKHLKQLRVFTLEGKEQFRRDYEDRQQDLSIELELSSNLYLVELVTDESIETYKVIVE